MKCLGFRDAVGVQRSLPVRGAWIEISIDPVMPSIMLSLPVRGAWIEMHILLMLTMKIWVAPRAGSVD